jgi:CheY-like chemotaxis protein
MYRIVLVDDDDVITMIHNIVIKKALKECNIETFPNASEALKYLEFLKENMFDAPDYIFLDINMPVTSGFEFAEIINEKYSDFLKKCKVILLSSSIDPRDIARADSQPIINQFASKPLSIDSVNEIILK